MGDTVETDKLSKKIDETDGSIGITFIQTQKVYKFKHYYQYPYFRMFVAYFVTICNFLIYAEDPVAHSLSKCEIPVVGNVFSMVATKYPSNAFSALKVFMVILAFVVGITLGKFVIHSWLLNKKLGVGMFKDDQGSWMICFFTTILVLLVSSAIYNLFLSLGSTMKRYTITGYIGTTNHTFMRAAALGTWFGDFITSWMVTDMMLQEGVSGRYKEWLPKVRRWWVKPWYRRVILFWVFTVTLTVIVIAAICSHIINWDKFNRDMFYTNELGRAFLASFILVMDFTIVMQDWDFPLFQSELEIKLPGVNTAHIKFEFPQWIRKNFVIHITGKWFQYGVLFMVLLLDLNMWKNQIFYEPLAYAQYVGENGHIFSVSDVSSLAYYGNATIYSYNWRNATIDPTTNKTFITGDYRTNSRYRGYSLAAKGMAFIPSLFTFVVFALFIHFFGKLPKETEEKDLSETYGAVSLTNVKSILSVKGKSSPTKGEYGPMSETPSLDGSEDVHASKDPQV